MPPKLYTLLFVAAILCSAASSNAQPLTFDQLAKATKIYFRDSAEFPLRMTMEFSATDANGKLRKHKTGKFDYDFHGYNARAARANLNMRGPKSSIKAGVSAGLAMLFPITVLFNKADEGYRFTAAEGSAPDLVSVKLVPLETCRPATWSVDSYLLNDFCGPAEFQVTRDEIKLRQFHFEAKGLPLAAKIDYLGAATVNHFYVDAEFQEVLIASDPKPFLVPKRVALTVETDKGKLLMTGDFAPKTKKK